MSSLYTGGRWCPACGSEYRPGFEECADCRALLVDTPPVGRVDERDHGQIEYDLANRTTEQRGALELLLVGRGIPHLWQEARLTVPRSREADVGELVDEMDNPPASESVPEPSVDTATLMTDDDRLLAGPGRRLVGALVDGAVLGLLAFVLTGNTWPGNPGATVSDLAVAAAAALYEVVPVVYWGRTLGKTAASTRVVNASTGALPSLRQASVRWAVPVAMQAVALFVGSDTSVVEALAFIGLLYQCVVYGGILWNPLRQGLHDKAAGTVVVRSRYGYRA